MSTSVVIVGAGPAGLTAAYQLAKRSVPVTVLEANPLCVGGLSRTVERDGFRVDIGGHRFYSRSRAIEDLWTEWLPEDFLRRKRQSRILYRGKFFSYPLKPVEALAKLGATESTRCALSYTRARLNPHPNPETFEQWVTNEFGARLYEIFFKTYTEKVWGMPCSHISADWAAQRIGGLSLSSLVTNAVLPAGRKSPKTLIESFRYPRQGPGMLWNACADKIRMLGSKIHLGTRLTELKRKDGNWLVETEGLDGKQTFAATHVVSTAPLRSLAAALGDGISDGARAAAEGLTYRDFLIVAITARPDRFLKDQWLYVHDERFRVGRVQNFRAWSPEMVPDHESACFGLEYFCHEGDGLWRMSDDTLLELAKSELVGLGIARPAEITGGFVLRQKKAYPIYDAGYASRVEELRKELADRYPTLSVAGRNGMHRYNNQDHAMTTGWIAAENILAGREVRNPWMVNQDADYLEEEVEERLVPSLIPTPGWAT
jgi:protoporphyrinogen oxidase